MTNGKIATNGALEFQTRRIWEGKKYGGLAESILLNPDGSLSNRLAITKHDKLVNTMSTAYHVFANEDLADIVEAVAKDVGAVPLQKKNGLGKWGKVKDNMITDSEYGTRAIMTYGFPDLKVDVTGQKDFNTPTFAASNSEDGRGGALKILGGFHRLQCDNLSYTFVPSREIAGLNASEHVSWTNASYYQKNPEIEAQLIKAKKAKKELLEKNKLPKFYTVHSKQISDMDKIKVQIREAIEAIKEDNKEVAKRYKQLYKLKLNSFLATQIVNRLPKSVYEAVRGLDVDKKGKVTFDNKMTDWKVYNDLTEELTYQTNRTKTFGSTMNALKKVEHIFLRQPIEVLAK